MDNMYKPPNTAPADISTPIIFGLSLKFYCNLNLSVSVIISKKLWMLNDFSTRQECLPHLFWCCFMRLWCACDTYRYQFHTPFIGGIVSSEHTSFQIIKWFYENVSTGDIYRSNIKRIDKIPVYILSTGDFELALWHIQISSYIRNFNFTVDISYGTFHGYFLLLIRVKTPWKEM